MARASNTRSATAAEERRAPQSPRLARDLIRLALATVVGLVLVIGYTTYRIWDQGGRDERHPADAIVVLGAAQYDGKPSPVLRSRLDHGISLWKSSLATYFVVTGGKQPADRTTEAAVARAYALARGVPDSAILVEDGGRNTLESLAAVGSLFDRYGLRSAIFVSDRPHMLRVLRIASDLGMTGWGSPTGSSPMESDSRRRIGATVHELGALALYFIAGEAPGDELAPPATEDPPPESSPSPSPEIRIRP